VLRGTHRLAALAAAGAFAVSACSSSGGAAAPTGPGVTPGPGAPAECATGTVTISGSTALQPLVAAAAKQYTAACPGATIVVNGGGSGTGLSQVAQGAVQIGDSDVTAQSKMATPEADKLIDHVVAKQGWIVVTNKDVTLTNLTTQQNVDIWTGKVTNWKDVGGPDVPIVLIFRPQSSGTRATFKKLVLGGASEATGGQTLTEDSNGTVTQAVSKTDGAVSVIGFAYYNDPANKPLLNGLALDGSEATIANMTAGTYKLTAEGHMYTLGEPSGLTRAFLDYMLGGYVQHTLIPSLSYAPVA
jgi:phosphate transport system substrate-binding protein